MNEERKDIQSNIKMLAIWQAVGSMGLDGRLSLDEVKVLTESLMVWASYVRNAGNKTWTAKELGKSRRVIRRIVHRLDGTGDDAQVVPESFRQWVLGQRQSPRLADAGSPLALQSAETGDESTPTSRSGASFDTSAAALDTHATEAGPKSDLPKLEPRDDTAAKD